jgi:hypothetical protein
VKPSSPGAFPKEGARWCSTPPPPKWVLQEQTNHEKGILGASRSMVGCTPSLDLSIKLAREERQSWEMAGAKGLSYLAALIPGD